MAKDNEHKLTRDFELAKYKAKWSVFDTKSRTFSYIGRGKRFCIKAIKELNNLIN